MFKSINLLGVLAGILILGSGCTSQEQKMLNDASAEIQAGNFRIALGHFDKVLIRSPNTEYATKAAQEAAKISFYDIKKNTIPRAWVRAVLLSAFAVLLLLLCWFFVREARRKHS